MPQQTIKTGRMFRAVTLERSAIDTESRTVELAFSSEQPVSRWFGDEILDHSAQSVRLGRLANGGPLLVDHNTRDHIGTVESVEIGTDRVGRAVVRFGKSARADEVFQDVLDGIRKHVSVGYEIHHMTMVEAGRDGKEPIYRADDWEPLEISLVAVPADSTVGVGRNHEGNHETVVDSPEPAAAEQPQTENIHQEIAMPDPVITQEEQERARVSAVADAVRSVNEIMAIGQRFARNGGEEVARAFIANGKTDVNEFRAALMDKIGNSHTDARDTELGLSDQEAGQFSFMRAIAAMVSGDWSQAGFEREVSAATAKKMGRSPQGIFVPMDVLRHGQRDMTVGTAGNGGYLVGTDLMPQDFISLLRNKLMVAAMGAKLLTGLQGNIAIPRQTGGATAYWVAESGAPSESTPTVDQVSLSPKTLGAYTDISRKLLNQSSMDMEQFVRADLAAVIATEIDRAAIHGSGSSNQPTGIIATSGIGDVAGGTNGAAPTWDHIIALETAVAVANADIGTLGYLTNSKVRGKLKGTVKASGQGGFVWGDGDMPLNGYKAGVTNQVSSALTKGSATSVCSAILFGNWADLIIGQWGALDLLVDPYTASTSGTVRVVGLQDVDIAVRNAASFAAMKDALTT